MELTLADYTFVEVGLLGSTRGTQGFIYCHFKDEYRALEEKADFLFLFDGGNPFPLKISDRKHKNAFLLKFKPEFSLEDVKQYTDKKVFLPQTDLEKYDLKINDADKLTQLNGFSFTDMNSDISGIICQVLQYPHQLMAEATVGNETFLFPLHENFILDINIDEKHIDFHLPEGIFNINE